MSGLSKQHPTVPRTEARIPQAGLVDPTVELSQPGGPFPYGDAILTDGAGGYTIAPTLRPYLLSFCLPRPVAPGSFTDCDHQGVSTAVVGVPVITSANLIGVGVSLNAAPETDHHYVVEVLRRLPSTPETEVVAGLDVVSRSCDVRYDLSVPFVAGSTIGVRVRARQAVQQSAFSVGIVTVELEG